MRDDEQIIAASDTFFRDDAAGEFSVQIFPNDAEVFIDSALYMSLGHNIKFLPP